MDKREGTPSLFLIKARKIKKLVTTRTSSVLSENTLLI